MLLSNVCCACPEYFVGRGKFQGQNEWSSQSEVVNVRCPCNMGGYYTMGFDNELVSSLHTLDEIVDIERSKGRRSNIVGFLRAQHDDAITEKLLR
ncbi:MAG: hypothetical protein O7C59_08330 [Rickettsia endosymbiont of Ixodes persulcatus]|nr:hypothetical protein [Rickettsia endosymbiont of Ixodes persulcatus]